MNSRIRLVLSGSLVIVAGAVAYTMTRSEPTPAEQTMEGHDHAAMLAGMEEAQPVRLSPVAVDEISD